MMVVDETKVDDYNYKTILIWIALLFLFEWIKFIAKRKNPLKERK